MPKVHIMNLDEYQNAVVKDNNDLLVIAGPGSGKTTTIIEKIKYILQDNNPEDILVLSFTNKSAEDIQKRLPNVCVMTFHKLAIDVIKTYKVKYQICDTTLLPYIINEYIKTLSKDEKEHLCRYLDILKISSTSYEYESFKRLIITFINIFKTNNHNISNLLNIINDYHDKFLSKIIFDILKIYEEEKRSSNTLDFDDLIIYATYLLKNNYKYKKYKFIIIDEFQDTSLIRLNLIKEIYNYSNSTITAVGDDAQSIFRFSGCDLNIFLNFKSYFPNSKLVFLKNTYRNSQHLIDISSSFIEKNPLQIKKNMISKIDDHPSIEIIYYYKKDILKRTIDKINNPNIMILSRNTKDIYNYLDKDITYNNNLITYKNNNYMYLTIHSSKGLESDYVIILNVSDNMLGIPNKIENHPILNYLYINKDNIPYAEERRVFFVGITRCKIKTYLLVPRKNPSIFVKEIERLL